MMNRRELFKAGTGVAAGVVAGMGEKKLHLSPTRVEAQVGDPIKNTRVEDLIPGGDYGHPMTGNTPWIYVHQLRNPGFDQSLASSTFQELNLTSNGAVGVDIRTDSRYLPDYLNGAARDAVWITTEAKSVGYVKLSDGSYGAFQADDKGKAGVLLPNRNVEFQLQIVPATQDGLLKTATFVFGTLSQEDAAKPLTANVFDMEAQRTQPATAPATIIITQPTQTIEQPVAIEQEQLPSFTFDQAPSDEYFHAISNRGDNWSRALQFALPKNAESNVTFFDKGQIGQFFAGNNNGADSVFFWLKIDKTYISDFQEGDPNNRASLWIHSQANSTEQVFDAQGNLYRQGNVDGAGYGGINLPTESGIFGVKITLSQPSSYFDTQFDFGAEHSQDRGKASTVDASQIIPANR